MTAERLNPLEQLMKRLYMEYFTGAITKQDLLTDDQSLTVDLQPIQERLEQLPDVWDGSRLDPGWMRPFLSNTPDLLHFRSFDHEAAGTPADHLVLLVPHQRYSPAFFHSHDYYELIYLTCGKCLNLFPDTMIEMEADQLLFLPPGQVHAISAFRDDCMLYNFLIRREALSSVTALLPSPEAFLSPEISDRLPQLDNGCVFQAKTDPAFSLRVRRLFKDYCTISEELRSAFLFSGFQQFFLLLISQYGTRLQPIRLQSPEASGRQLLACIEEECATITLSELAWRFGYSYEHISRVIKRQTGSSFAKLRCRCRMEKAARLLRESSLSVEAVMLQCGYESRSSFFGNFRSFWGITPAKYRHAMK